MSRFRVVHVTRLCALLSFLYTSESLQRHSLVERPRLSLTFVFFIAGVASTLVSYISKWSSEARDRFGALHYEALDPPTLDLAPDEVHYDDSNSRLPDRPRKYAFAAMVVLISLRIELIRYIARNQQCSSPGIEAFLCIILFGYDIFLSRRKWGVPPPDDPDDPWRSIFDDIHDWLSGPRVVMVMAYLGTSILSLGTYLATSQITPSGYFCLRLIDSRGGVILLQWASLIVDAVITVLFWRIMAWTRSTQARLQNIGKLLVLSSLCIAVPALGELALGGTSSIEPAFGSLYPYEHILDGIVLASFFCSIGSWISEEAPLVPASTATVLVGICTSLHNIRRFEDWISPTQVQVLLPLWTIFIGTTLFIYCQDLRTFLFARRPGFTIIFFIFLSVTSIYAALQTSRVYKVIHPIDDLIYKAQTKHEHWAKEVKMSGSLAVAVRNYLNAHSGRLPPPHFSDWYRFAEGSAVIDEFRQIESDLSPFRHIAPQAIRDRVEAVTAYPGVTTITIRAGQVFTADTGIIEDNKDLEELSQSIRKFSSYLPDMVLPINLRPTPRILPKWEDKSSKYMPPPVQNGSLEQDYGQMQVRACPPDSRARRHPDWTYGELCFECGQTHSHGPLISNWEEALDVCAQPDLVHLHGFPMLKPLHMPIEGLLPLFGPSKTNGFRDILIPIPKSRLEKPDNKWQFGRRYDALFWEGTVGSQAVSKHALRGSHKYRFLHLARDPSSTDEVSMILPAHGDKTVFTHEKISARKANSVVPFTAGLRGLDMCLGDGCQFIEQAFGTREEAAEPMEYRYVLLLDEDDGPPPELLRTLRSNSVPFISTIFRTWYTERLTPWLHFVPIDIRYQTLHTAFAYFSGTVDRPPVNDNPKPLDEHTKHAEWIMEQGKKWAESAISTRDMEIYLFRLLLEWGRLINDRRDDIGFRIGEGGQQVNDGWR